ncbi:MAG: DNA-protecting protein DprA [Betaproteobacteria bacterium]|nr:MAG: DNA-protecting protein DprA [Betaproteobacteria bacterium]
MPQSFDDELFLKLSLTRGIGARTAHKLLSEFGDVGAVFTASESMLAQSVGAAIARAIKAPLADTAAEKLAAALTWLTQSEQHHLLSWSHERYPKALLESGDAPLALFAKGHLDALDLPAIAMVGSRNCSQGGADTASSFAQTFAERAICVVSGMALGIDAAAHLGALRANNTNARTIAVIGTGIDRIYPARNKTLAHSIAERGLILSEYPMGTPPLAENFPRRNRIISGLSQGVLVVEASMASGSLITARLAGEQGREVFAIPGSIHSTFHKGCHHLIKQGAKLVETAQDVLEELRLATPAERDGNGTKTALSSDVQTGIAKYLEHDPMDVDALVERSGLSVEQVVTELTLLELAGGAEQLAGGLWQRR